MTDDGALLALGTLAALAAVGLGWRRGSRDLWDVTVERRQPGPKALVGQKRFEVDSEFEDDAELHAELLARAQGASDEGWRTWMDWGDWHAFDPDDFDYEVTKTQRSRRSIRGNRSWAPGGQRFANAIIARGQIQERLQRLGRPYMEPEDPQLRAELQRQLAAAQVEVQRARSWAPRRSIRGSRALFRTPPQRFIEELLFRDDLIALRGHPTFGEPRSRAALQRLISQAQTRVEAARKGLEPRRSIRRGR